MFAIKVRILKHSKSFISEMRWTSLHYYSMNAVPAWDSWENRVARELKTGCTLRVALLRVKRMITTEISAASYIIQEQRNAPPYPNQLQYIQDLQRSINRSQNELLLIEQNLNELRKQAKKA